MYNYCTLFDSNFLTRGLAMYESLKIHSDTFHLYVFAFDLKSYDLLTKLKLEKVTIISLKEFEDEELLKIKKDRSVAEYCWTCTPSIIKYSIEKYNLTNCTYLDADLYFFSNPSLLIEEMQDNSVLITEHRYSPKYDQSDASGIYCVQFMTFKNDLNGMKALNWWRAACIDWCYAKVEDGKFGDQKYLDDWTVRFKGVHVLKNLGGGVAPWNIQQYNLLNKQFELVFYHFHDLRFLKSNKVDLGVYELSNNDIKILYVPYIQHHEDIVNKLKHIDHYNYNGVIHKQSINWKDFLKRLKKKIRRNINGTYFVYYKKKLMEK